MTCKAQIVLLLKIIVLWIFFYVIVSCLYWGAKHPKASVEDYIKNANKILLYSTKRKLDEMP